MPRPALLAGLGWVERVSGLAAAVPVASDEEVDTLGAALISELDESQHGTEGAEGFWDRILGARRRGEVEAARARGVAAVIGNWARLRVSTRERALRVLVGCEGAAIEWAADARVEARVSAVRFAADSAHAELFGVVCGGVVDDDPRVGGVAEESLVWLAARVMGLNGRDLEHRVTMEFIEGVEPGPVESRAALRDHVAGLCAAYGEYRRKGVLAAAMALLEPGAVVEGALGAWLRDESSPGLPALRTLLRRGSGAVSRRRAFEWLTVPTMASAAEDRLARGETREELEVVLRGAHLLENPRRCARMGGVMSRVRGTGQSLSDMDAGGRRGAARWVGLVWPEHLSAVSSAALTDVDDAVRLSAVKALSGSELLDFCFDRSGAIAMAASTKWWLGGTADECERRRTAGNLARSPHEAVRRVGLRFERQLAGAVGQRERELAHIGEDLRSSDCGVVIGAISRARRRGLAREIVPELTALTQAGEGWERVVACAVAALGETGAGGAWEALEPCLGHADARVRANAAEALAKAAGGRGDLAGRWPRLYDRFIEMKVDASHRVRSSVIRAVLRASSPEWGGTGFEPAAADELVRMLEDERPMHRLAGLWAVEHVPMGESLGRRWDRVESLVAGLLRNDADDAVQRRAVWCARRLLSRGGIDKEPG